MLTLLLGTDIAAKDQALASLKEKYCTKPDAALLDCDILHAPKLDGEVLQKSLLALPVVSYRRLVVVRLAEKLTARLQEIVLQFAQTDSSQVVLVLDIDDAEAADAFLNKLRPGAKIIACGIVVKANVFDLTKAIAARNGAEALKVLDGLVGDGVHPLQIMGGVVWHWAKSRNTFSKNEYEKGLLALKEADEQIKRSRLEATQAIELLVVKLASISAG